MRKRTNKVRSKNGYYVVDIGTDKSPSLKMLIDKDDYERIRMLSKSRMTPKRGAKENDPIYARMRVNGKVVLVHRLVLGLKIKHFDVDHINHNTLDNRRCNLRICTRFENLQNRTKSINNKSGYTGVSWSKCRMRWKANIMVRGFQTHLGFFEKKEDAIVKRLEAEVKHFGDFMPEQNTKCFNNIVNHNHVPS